MKRCILYLFSYLLIVELYGQDLIKKYVVDHTIEIKTIDPESTEYSDLEPLGKAIGDAQVVMLGEQDHGDAPTFLAKTRLIKYLHEKKGFNVLAFESDFYGLTKGWDEISKEETAISNFLKKNIFQIWTHCNTCSWLFNNYIATGFNTDTPLQITGFDNQLVLNYSRVNLTKNLDSLFRALNLPVVHLSNYQSAILPSIDTLISSYNNRDRAQSWFSATAQYLSLISNQLNDKVSLENFWIVVIQNLLQLNREFSDYRDQTGNSYNVRDAQMASNLEWLLKYKYRNEKIIVWAHNTHIARTKKQNQKSMGQDFLENTPDRLKQTYILGFTSAYGSTGRVTFSQSYNVGRPAKNSFERWMLKKNAPYAFLDFQAFMKQHPDYSSQFEMKGFSHFSATDNWTAAFDGVFFIKDMYPCERIP